MRTRIAIIVATVFAALVIGRVILWHKLSQAYLQRPNFVVANALNPDDGIIAGYLAWTLQKIGRPDLAEPVARRAFLDTPLSAPALGTLAMSTLPRDPRLGVRLVGQAAAMGWRDSTLQVWMARDALAKGDAAAAALHIDAAARVEGVTDDVRGVLDRMANSQESRTALAARLGLGPQWRANYFLSPVLPLGDLGARARALAAIGSAPVPASRQEAAMLLTIAAKAVDLVYAYAMWRYLMRPQIPHFVFDPDFRHLASRGNDPSPFDWMVGSTLGVSSDVAEAGGRTSLHLSTDGTAVGPIALQIVRIPPGRHRMQAAGRYTSPAMASGFRWSIVCGDAHHPTTPLTPLSGTATGSGGFDFEIPADGSCPMQWLELAATQANAPGQIDAWFNDVQIL